MHMSECSKRTDLMAADCKLSDTLGLHNATPCQQYCGPKLEWKLKSKYCIFFGAINFLFAHCHTNLCSASSQVVTQLRGDVGLCVSVSIFGTDGNFLIDTGAEATVLDDKYRVRLGKPKQAAAVRTVDAPQLETFLYDAPEMTIEGGEVQPDSVLCLDLSPISQFIGVQIDGILGMDVMGHRVVSINPDERVFSITDTVTSQEKDHRQTIPLLRQRASNSYSLETRLNDSVTIYPEIDTGSNMALSLSEFDWQRVFAERGEDTDRRMLVGLMGKSAPVQFDRLAKVLIGTNSFTNVLAQTDSGPIQKSTLGPWIAL